MDTNGQSNVVVKKLFKIQNEISAVKKTSTNPHFRSKYADLNEVLDVVKEQLNKNNLLLTQPAGKDEYGAYVETQIFDGDTAGGISTRVYLSGSEDNMQKVGAAITYARRYGLVSLLALESEDDDGETAVGRGPAQAVKPEVKRQLKVDKPVQKSSQREVLNELISKTAQTLVDQETMTFDEVYTKLQEYGVENKEALNDTQAKEFLNVLRGKLGG